MAGAGLDNSFVYSEPSQTDGNRLYLAWTGAQTVRSIDQPAILLTPFSAVSTGAYRAKLPVEDSKLIRMSSNKSQLSRVGQHSTKRPTLSPVYANWFHLQSCGEISLTKEAEAKVFIFSRIGRCNRQRSSRRCGLSMEMDENNLLLAYFGDDCPYETQSTLLGSQPASFHTSNIMILEKS